MATLVSTAQITITDSNDYISTGATAPANPVANETLWVDTTVTPNQLKKWTGTAWEIVNEVQVGGRNLLTGTKNWQGWGGVGVIQSTPTQSGLYPVFYDNTLATSGYVELKQLLSVHLKPSTTYTLSFFAKGTGLLYSYIYPSVNSLILFRSAGGSGSVSGSDTASYWTLTTEYKKFYVTFKTLSSVNESNAVTMLFRLLFGNSAYVYGAQLELGNVATDWTAAPEDIDATIATAQGTANSAAQAAALAQTDATNALNKLTTITSDNILSASEKSSQRLSWNTIAAEKASINAQATAFGVTTENTAYNSAFQALATYLNAVTVWSTGVPSWLSDTNLSTDTAIVGATYRSNWETFYSARTALLNAISAKAKALADGAQSSVDNLQVGGRNLLLNTKSDFQTVISAGWGITAFDYIPASLGDRLIGKVFIRNVTYPIMLEIHELDSSKQRLKTFNTVVVDGGAFILPITVTNQSTAFVQMDIAFQTVVTTNQYEYAKPKLERGNKVTDWTAAPEDVDAAISTAQTSADGKSRHFTGSSNPSPPYTQGLDTWTNGSDLYECAITRAAGATYVAGDFVKAVGYDNTATVINGGLVTSGTVQLAGDASTILAGITGQGTADTSIRMWAGASYANRANAPFRVQQNGEVFARKRIELCDSSNNGVAGIAGSNSPNDNSVAFWAGANYAGRQTAPFRVLHNGYVAASNIEIATYGTSGRRIALSTSTNNISMYRDTVRIFELRDTYNADFDAYLPEIYIQDTNASRHISLTSFGIYLGGANGTAADTSITKFGIVSPTLSIQNCELATNVATQPIGLVTVDQSGFLRLRRS